MNPMRFKSKGPKFETVGKTAPFEGTGSAGKSPLSCTLASLLVCPRGVSPLQISSPSSAITPSLVHHQNAICETPPNNSSSMLSRRRVYYSYLDLLI